MSNKQLIILTFLMLTPIAWAKDVADAEDHPLISRYPDSVITAFSETEFGDYRIPMSAPFKISTKEYAAEMTKSLQGKITRLVYATAQDASDIQIHQNYVEAFAKGNFQIIRQCQGAACEATAKYFARFLDQPHVSFRDKSHAFFIVAQQTRENSAPVYVVVLNGGMTNKKSNILIDVIETQTMEVGKVSTNADALLQSLQQSGKAQIYDIYFDTGKALLKEESGPALEAIAQVLQRESSLYLYVVGHTDDTGSLSLNSKLANDRASAIVKFLTANQGINKERLYAAGVGPFAPVASNESEQGRALNRRVEIVKRLR